MMSNAVPRCPTLARLDGRGDCPPPRLFARVDRILEVEWQGSIVGFVSLIDGFWTAALAGDTVAIGLYRSRRAATTALFAAMADV